MNAREPAGPTVFSGAAAALSGQLLIYTFGFVTSVLIARAVGADGRGAYYLPVTAAAVAVTLAHIGLETAQTVAFANWRTTLAELSRNASMMALALGPPAVLLAAIVFAATRGTVFAGVEPGNFLLIAATIPFSLHLLWLVNIFVLAKRLPRSQLALMTGALVQVVAAAVLSAAGELSLRAIVYLYDLSVLIPWALLVIWSRRFAPAGPALNRRLMRRLTSFGLRFQGGLVLSYLLLRVDVFLVGLYLSVSDVGVYSLAVLFAELAWLVTNPLVQAAIPFQAELELASSGRLAFKAARFNTLLALGMSLVFAASLWWVIPFLYGAAFQGAYPATVALLPGIVAMAACRPVTLIIARRNQPLVYSGLAFVAFAINCALNVILLPSIGILGASVSSSIAYAALAATFIVWALRITGLSPRDALVPHRDDLESVRAALAVVARSTTRTRRASPRAHG